MSQKLATFKVDEEKWKAFQEIADAENTSASAMLKDFIDWVIEGNRLKESTTPNIDQRIDAKLAALQKQSVDEALAPLKVELAELRGKLSA